MRIHISTKKKWSMPFVSLAMILVLSITSIATSTIEELENENEELEEQIGVANSETVSLEEQLSEINSELLAVNEELEEINGMIELTESQMGRTLDDLAASKLEEQEQYENMKARIRYMYEAGNSTFLEMLMGAESLVDFVNKTEFISNVTEYDRDMLAELTAIRETIEIEEATLLDEQTALVELQVDAEIKVAELQVLADETETDLDEVYALISQLETEQAKVEEEKTVLEEEAKAQAEAEKEEQQNATSNSGSDYAATSSDVDLLAAILDCEASSNYTSMLAVATVIMNRVESSKFPNSVSGVIYANGQFSPTWTGKLDRVLASGASSTAYEVAEAALNGERLDSVSDCYYFLYAASSSRDGVVIGGNVFFKSW